MRDSGEFRRRAREAADGYFPEEASEQTEYFGTIYRYEGGKSKTVVGFLTRKEKLFGEWGRPTHIALVRYFRRGSRVLIPYSNLTQQDLAFLKKVLAEAGLEIIEE